MTNPFLDFPPESPSPRHHRQRKASDSLRYHEMIRSTLPSPCVTRPASAPNLTPAPTLLPRAPIPLGNPIPPTTPSTRHQQVSDSLWWYVLMDLIQKFDLYANPGATFHPHQGGIDLTPPLVPLPRLHQELLDGLCAIPADPPHPSGDPVPRAFPQGHRS